MVTKMYEEVADIMDRGAPVPRDEAPAGFEEELRGMRFEELLGCERAGSQNIDQ